MIRKIVEEYLNQIHAKKYSIITINPLDEVSIISNQPQAWEQDFIKMKLHLRSNIVLKAKDKITPFWWSVQSITNDDVRKIAEKYNIHCGITFIINIKYDHIIFTLCYDGNDGIFLICIKMKSTEFYLIFLVCLKIIMSENQYVV